MMISGLSSDLTILILGAPILLLIMLLPSFHELRKPKDAGPRMIIPKENKASKMRIFDFNNKIENIEEPENGSPNNSPDIGIVFTGLFNIEA
jgi:hypothetical protein